jgi:hypothetical protein
MMYYGPGMGGWGMTFMIIGTIVLGFVDLCRSPGGAIRARGQDCFRPTRRGIATADRGAAVRPRRDHRGGVPASVADPVRGFCGGSQEPHRGLKLTTLVECGPICDL